MKYLVSLLILLSTSNVFAGNKISTPKIQYENYTFKANEKIHGKIVYFDLVVDEFESNPNSELYLAAHIKKDFLEHWIICNVFVYRWDDKNRETGLKTNMIGYSGPLGRQIRLHKKHFMDFYFADKDMKSGSKYRLVLLVSPKLIEIKNFIYIEGNKPKDEPEYVFDKTPIKNLEPLIKKDMIVIKPHYWDIQKIR